MNRLPPAGLAFDFSALTSAMKDMGTNIVSNLTKALPKVAVDTLAAVTVSKLSSKLAGGGGSSGGGGGAKPAAGAAPAGAQAPQDAASTGVPAPAAPTPAKAALPGWVLPVGIGVGVVTLAILVVPALRGGKRR